MSLAIFLFICVQKAQLFQQSDLLESGSKKTRIQVEDIDGIIRGKFYYKYPKVTIFFELVWLNGFETRSTKLELNAANISAEIIPSSLKESTKKIVDVRDNIKNIPHEFEIKLGTVDVKRDFRSGEKIQFKIRAERDCHIAVFCHQNDGSTVLLFPNAWNSSAFVKGSTDILIPQKQDSNFEIEACQTFGSDVIQVIGCTRKSELHSEIEQLVQKQPDAGYRSLSRGLISKAVDESIGNSTPEDLSAGKPLWGESQIVISTFK